MTRTLILSLILIVASAFGGGKADELRPSAEHNSEWKPLFDGASLAGWRGYAEDAPGAGWKVINGELSLQGPTGDLVTLEQFGDFELSLEWKIGKGGNSGIIYRVGMGETDTFVTGPEYQLLDDQDAKESPEHLSGAIYDISAPVENATRRAGNWNETRIVVHGWNIQHWLNGKKVVDLDLESAEGKKLVAKSKFGSEPKFASLRRGRIALQDHGDPVSFRRIQIRQLN